MRKLRTPVVGTEQFTDYGKSDRGLQRIQAQVCDEFAAVGLHNIKLKPANELDRTSTRVWAEKTVFFPEENEWLFIRDNDSIIAQNTAGRPVDEERLRGFLKAFKKTPGMPKTISRIRGTDTWVIYSPAIWFAFLQMLKGFYAEPEKK